MLHVTKSLSYVLMFPVVNLWQKQVDYSDNYQGLLYVDAEDSWVSS